MMDREVNVLSDVKRKVVRNLFAEHSRINGKLTFEQCQTVLRKARYPMPKANVLLLETAFDEFAVDGAITNYRMMLRVAARWVIYTDEDIRRSFASLENDDGEIQTSELRSILTKLQAVDGTIASDTIDKMIDSVDPDEDGTISYSQYALMLLHRGDNT